MSSNRANHSLTDQDIEEDAQGEPESSGEVEHFDGAVVYAENDKEKALDIMEEMTKIVLTNGDKPKICLYSDPKCAASEIAAGQEITKICTLIFVLVTKDLQTDTVAQLIKDEAIGNTRLAKTCHPDLKYCVRPLYIEKERDYKAPCGLSTIQSVNWYDKKSRFFERSINQLFEQHMQYRKKRECFCRQNSARSRSNVAQYNINHLQPDMLQLPPSMDDNKSFNHMASVNSAQYTPRMSENGDVPNHPNSLRGNALASPREIFCQVRSSEAFILTSNVETPTVHSEDSGRGASLSPNVSTVSYRTRVSAPVTESCGSTNDASQEKEGSQNNDAVTTVYNSLSTIPQSSSSNGSTGSFESGSHGFDANPSTGSNSRTSDDTLAESEEAGTSSSSKPSTSSQTSEEETDGSSLIQSDLPQLDVVEDVSFGSKTTESQDAHSAQNTLEAGLPSEISGTNTVSSQTSDESLNPVRSASFSDESVGDNVEFPGKHDKDTDDNDPDTIASSSQDTSRELILKHHGAAHRPVARCAAPNDEFANGEKMSPPAVSPQPMVVHYHNHYHGDARSPAVFPPPPGAPLPNIGHAGMPGPTFQQPSGGPQQITSANQGNLNLRSEGPINIVNCEHVQIGMNQMDVSGGLPEVTTNNTGQSTGMRSVPEDPPPPYSAEDPSQIGEVSSYYDHNQPQEQLPSSTIMKQPEQINFNNPRPTYLDHNSDEETVGRCSKKDQTQTKEGGGQITNKTDASADLEFPSDFSSLPNVVTRDGSHSSESSGKSSGYEVLYSRLEETGEEKEESVDCPETAFADYLQDTKNGADELSSFPVPELGSGDDLQKFLVPLSEETQDQYTSREKLPSAAMSSGLNRLHSCRLFCKHKRRQDMFVDIGRRMVAAGGPCLSSGGYDSDID